MFHSHLTLILRKAANCNYHARTHATRTHAHTRAHTHTCTHASTQQARSRKHTRAAQCEAWSWGRGAWPWRSVPVTRDGRARCAAGPLWGDRSLPYESCHSSYTYVNIENAIDLHAAYTEIGNAARFQREQAAGDEDGGHVRQRAMECTRTECHAHAARKQRLNPAAADGARGARMPSVGRRCVSGAPMAMPPGCW
jgi:hypothetical protein